MNYYKQMNSDFFEKKKILFASVPVDGHFNPLTGLAKFFQTLGSDVRWYTTTQFSAKLDRLGIPLYPFTKALDINASNLSEVVPERIEIIDPGEKLDFDLTHIFGNRSLEYYEDIIQIHKEFPFDFLIADSLFTAIPFIREKMRLPVFSIGIIPLAEYSSDLAPYGTGLPPAQNADGKETYKHIREKMLEKVLKGSIDNFESILNEFGIPNQRSDLFDLLIRQSSLYLQIGVPSFEYRRNDLGKNIRFIGALYAYSAKNAQDKWFDHRINQYSRIILLTQGTIEKDARKLLIPTLDAFKSSNVLVIATTGGSQTAELRNQYAFPNIIIEDYIPFDDVMPFATVFISNGGYGGALLSIKNELPIIAAGVFEGKNEVCARIGYFQIGIDLRTETPTPHQILAAFEDMISNKDYKNRIHALAEEFKRYNAYKLCSNYISEYLLEYHLHQTDFKEAPGRNNNLADQK